MIFLGIIYNSMIELLAPAGSPEALDAAIAEGADGVYLGLKSFNARMRSANFAYSQFEGALRALHRNGRRLYVTVNTVFEQREADRVYQLLKYLAATGPDGIIVQDFGIVMMAREFKQLKIHASTQMNIASARGANVLSKHGVSRVVLARELSLEEIRSIRENTNMELEVFVHGALCASASGLCLFSSYLGGKSANRGQCTQACRRIYYTEDEVGSYEETSLSNKGYFFSPCDLSLIEQIPLLAEAGVQALKIEGRMKSAEYVGTVVSAYRMVIDSLGGGEALQRQALENAQLILRNDFARPKTEFFFKKVPGTIFRPEQDGGTGINLGTIVKVKSGHGLGRLGIIKDQRFAENCTAGRIRLSAGDSLRFHRVDDSRRVTHKLSYAESSGTSAYLISIPEGFEPGDSVYLIQTKSGNKRYPPVIPKDLSPYKRQPGMDRAPKLPLSMADKIPLQEGIFVQVASTEDLYIVQSQRPAGVILPLNRKNARSLLDKTALPFKSGEIILALDPWFEENDEKILAELIEQLKEKGYFSYILNNPGHFSFFRNTGKSKKSAFLLVAGPWLYTFNAWAVSFAALEGAALLVSPLENNRQNLEKTVPAILRRHVFITLFAWPPLFRIKNGPDGFYRFSGFRDNREGSFSLIKGDESVVVIPDTPFCITDKRPFLTEAGFRRFIVDFSGGMYNGSFPLNKKLYKEVIKAAQEGSLLSQNSRIPGFSRFNWKNGFFSEKNTID